MSPPPPCPQSERQLESGPASSEGPGALYAAPGPLGMRPHVRPHRSHPHPLPWPLLTFPLTNLQRRRGQCFISAGAGEPGLRTRSGSDFEGRLWHRGISPLQRSPGAQSGQGVSMACSHGPAAAPLGGHRFGETHLGISPLQPVCTPCGNCACFSWAESLVKDRFVFGGYIE